MDFQKILNSITEEIVVLENNGAVASYIPELGKVSPDKFGVCLRQLDDAIAKSGDYNERFSIQSIAKVLAMTLAYKLEGEKIWSRVGVEPSGNAFNSLVQLEYEKGIPRNPLINAGALVVSDILVSVLNNPKHDFLQFVLKLTGSKEVEYSKIIAESEKGFGYTNKALINLMKAFGNIENDIDEVLDFYFHLCSIELSCEELSKTFLFLANDGLDPVTNEVIITPTQSKRVNSIMQLCGFYDEAGEFSFKVGLPGKSGVGGGIVAINPHKYCIVVWSPPLNKKGNSSKGMMFLEKFTFETSASIF